MKVNGGWLWVLILYYVSNMTYELYYSRMCGTVVSLLIIQAVDSKVGLLIPTSLNVLHLIRMLHDLDVIWSRLLKPLEPM